jgi:hypothetical protein
MNKENRTISVARLNEQRGSVNVRNVQLEIGEKLKFMAYTTGEVKRGTQTVANDSFVYVSDKRGVLKFSGQEFNQLRTKAGLLTAPTGNEFVIPAVLSIAGSEPRLNAAGKEVYPVSAYPKAQAFYKSLTATPEEKAADGYAEVDYNELVKDEPIAGSKPVNNYTVEVIEE